jgi:hypothetical protein
VWSVVFFLVFIAGCRQVLGLSFRGTLLLGPSDKAYYHAGQFANS